MGAVFGACIVRAGLTSIETSDKRIKYFPNPAILCPTIDNSEVPNCDNEDTYGQVFVAELVATFIYVTVILNIKNHNGSNEAVLDAAT